MNYRPEDFRFYCGQDVQWSDMDTLGHVNNARYFTYFESARLLYFQRIGMKEIITEGQGPVLANAQCDFHRQLHWPSHLEVGVSCDRLSQRSFNLIYGLFRSGPGSLGRIGVSASTPQNSATPEAGENDPSQWELIASGSSVVVWVDFGLGKAVAIPDYLRDGLKELDDVG
ncbi:MAG: thioesterase family protein [Acidobacteriota bacterium]